MKIQKVLSRVYVGLAQLDETVAFYEQLFGEKSRRRFTYHRVGLELTMVGAVLILAGPEPALARFKETGATFLVDDLDEFAITLPKMGGTILEAPKEVPTGRNMRVRHLDGTIVEYVQHRAPDRPRN